ncbi:hypothetical protein [Actinoplanes palleronii]|uniref:Uncharacterized protein n=1 Tax=Actinoplanes palleronii TaxID=113570 RepID=A0ABQ4B2A7_9ACTN|nr:hypothetical protein [Actinoplanes palleronii]GIE64802.1 hypothetical protein Apa02nite_009100 [Actinoplanes palleronii]
MDRRTAENLLRGAPGHPVSGLLAAATAPATAGELAGEAAAMAAFRAAAQSPGPVPRRRRSFLAKLLTVKMAAVVFATSATVGGVALAANTGALPGPVRPGKPSHAVSSGHSATPSHTTHPQPTQPTPSSQPARTQLAQPRKTGYPCQELRDGDRDRRTQHRKARSGNRCGTSAPRPSGTPRTARQHG